MRLKDQILKRLHKKSVLNLWGCPTKNIIFELIWNAINHNNQSSCSYRRKITYVYLCNQSCLLIEKLPYPKKRGPRSIMRGKRQNLSLRSAHDIRLMASLFVHYLLYNHTIPTQPSNYNRIMVMDITQW